MKSRRIADEAEDLNDMIIGTVFASVRELKNLPRRVAVSSARRTGRVIWTRERHFLNRFPSARRFHPSAMFDLEGWHTVVIWDTTVASDICNYVCLPDSFKFKRISGSTDFRLILKKKMKEQDIVGWFSDTSHVSEDRSNETTVGTRRWMHTNVNTNNFVKL